MTTTLYFDTYPDLRRVFGATVTALEDNPMIRLVSRSHGAERIDFNDGYTLRFRVTTSGPRAATASFAV